MDFVEHFQDIGIEADLFVYTREEVEQNLSMLYSTKENALWNVRAWLADKK